MKIRSVNLKELVHLLLTQESVVVFLLYVDDKLMRIGLEKLCEATKLFDWNNTS